MSEFNVRSESIDVEKLMEQIRARIREKRGVDYDEQQVRELAAAKLDRFLDPRNVRSDLLEQYRRRTDDAPDAAAIDPPPAPPQFEFEQDTIYRSSRGFVGRVLYGIRRMLRPVLKLFFNPTPIVHALHTQRQINELHGTYFEWTVNRSEEIAAKLKARAELDALTYELLHNLVVEMTRLSLDVKNHKMRVESIAGRLDFDERRARALESVVAYRTQIAPPGDGEAGGEADESAGAEKRKRRRRRGRRRSAAKPSAEDGAEAATAASAGDGPAAAEPAAAEAASRAGESTAGAIPTDAPAPPEAVAEAPEPADRPAAGATGAGEAADTGTAAREAPGEAPDPDDSTAR